ncbi:hypothetical protein DVP64_02990 [Yersinia enterocolitica]|nr:hypothetical protein [Yersinia enterocolitica]EKN5105228.1 hypothetical protein [Yersinia enterocolitica]EKN6361304.1 hypothetical protein [Yersinia enterocolitica]
MDGCINIWTSILGQFLLLMPALFASRYFLLWLPVDLFTA